MIEIFALIFLCKKIGNLANQKGLNAGVWKLVTVLSWIIAEFTGILLGIILFGNVNIGNMKDFDKIDTSALYGLEAMALICAFGGYLIVKAILEKKPDSYDDDINKINVNDLRPPQKN